MTPVSIVSLRAMIGKTKTCNRYRIPQNVVGAPVNNNTSVSNVLLTQTCYMSSNYVGDCSTIHF